MRRSSLLIAMLFFACGSGDDGGQTTVDGGSGTTNPPDCDVFSNQCKVCASALSSDSAACAIDPEACTAMQDSMVAEACFKTEGQCQKAALFKAADCHRACCDVEQANVETCTADCMVTRAECHVSEFRKFDLCYMICNDVLTCGLCDADFQGASNQCNANAVACSDLCVRTHRTD